MTVLKESFVVDHTNSAFYTGGKVSWSTDGELLFCQTANNVNVVEVNSGTVRCSLIKSENDEANDGVLCFTTDRRGERIIIAQRSSLISMWEVATGSRLKAWKSVHRGPISTLSIHSSGDILASGGSDGVIRLWDLPHNACTTALRGAQGVVSVVEFHELDGVQMVFGCGDDLSVHCWDCDSGALLHSLEGHFSKITALAFHHTGRFLVSSSRDKVLILWDLTTWTSAKTVPLYEGLESVVMLPKKFELPAGTFKKGVHVAVAGESGVIRVVEMQSGRVVFNQEEPSSSIAQLIFNQATNSLCAVTVDHNMALWQMDTFKCSKQLVGFSDEVLDVAFVGPDNTYLAVATNSNTIQLYNLKNHGCQLLRGHADFVLCLATSHADPNILLSGSKDGCVQLWELNVEDGTMISVAVGHRHTAAVSSVTFFQLSSDSFLSASADTTLKLWTKEESSLIVRQTEVAHAKDINSVAVSPNDRLVATASQDKTAKLWDLSNFSLLGVLSGHRRGVWCARFSPVDQVLLTSSADCTLKLWSIADLTCLKTLQGHESSVMRAEFLSRGMQIVSVSGDGLMKLWTIKTGECAATFDGHDGKIWTLAVRQNEEGLVTGGSDSKWLIWRDNTEEIRLAAIKDRETKLMQEQKLSNLIQANQLLDALSLALDLDMPFKVLNILKDLQKCDDESLVNTVSSLSDDQKEKLLKCASTWNCNAKHCSSAQLVISALLKDIAVGKFTMPGLASYVEEVLPYTERHFKRLTSALQNLHLLQFTMRRINPAYRPV